MTVHRPSFALVASALATLAVAVFADVPWLASTVLPAVWIASSRTRAACPMP